MSKWRKLEIFAPGGMAGSGSCVGSLLSEQFSLGQEPVMGI